MIPRTISTGGAAFGVRTSLSNLRNGKKFSSSNSKTGSFLNEAFSRMDGVLLVADAYRGSEIRQSLTDFYRAAAGIPDKESTAA
jgi:hypothetical protein